MTKMRIGFHSWSPGLANRFKEADPNHGWILYLAEELEKQDIELVWLGNTHPAYGMKHYVGDSPEKILDGSVFYWRTQFQDTPKFRERNKAFARQQYLIQRLTDAGKKICIFDGDYWITKQEQSRLEELGAILVAPALRPRKGFQKLFYPPYLKEELNGETERHNSIVYIGNNYGRYEMTQKYLGFKKRGVMVDIYGNWLEPSDGSRESPEQVMRDFPYARFLGRSDQHLAVPILKRHALTIHLAKPEYAKTGFLALRWLEAVMAGTPALIPMEWRLRKHVLGRITSLLDVEEIAINMEDPYWRTQVYRSQREFVLSHFNFDNWKWLCHLLADESKR